MLTRSHVEAYRGPALERGDSYVYLVPHPLLLPYIPCYTLTCPVASGMTPDYTILPSASTTMIFSIGENRIDANIRGVNTVACVVGGHARRYKMLLLIEFHPGALSPFLKLPLGEFANTSADLKNMDRQLQSQIEQAILSANSVTAFQKQLDEILLRGLYWPERNPQFLEAIECIRRSRGVINGSRLSQEVHYSERHLRRLFQEYLGTGVKTFSRIVRVNHAVSLLCRSRVPLEIAAGLTGYYDPSHMIRDFRECCGITPQEYLKKMSVFYSDNYKL